MLCLEDLVPDDHLLRKIESAVNFNKIYEFVEDLYCDDNGRPSVDPVVLFKMVLIQHLYGVLSLRRTAKLIENDILHFEKSVNKYFGNESKTISFCYRMRIAIK